MNRRFPPSLSVGTCAELACLLEATARKPGNVHPGAAFGDCSYLHYIASSVLIGPVLEQAAQRGIGPTVLECVRRTRQVTGTNTNLGISLLLAPLATVSDPTRWPDEIAQTLAGLTHDDAKAAYEAIRLAQPGGLGRVPEQDVAQEPIGTLVEVMALAAERDLVARQYTNGFREVLEVAMPSLKEGMDSDWGLEQAIIRTHLYLMAHYPDSLIARKRGPAEAQEAARWAGQVLEQDWPDNPAAQERLDQLDAWLRAEGNARNPGTTADLLTAGLFVALRSGMIKMPIHW